MEKVKDHNWHTISEASLPVWVRRRRDTLNSSYLRGNTFEYRRERGSKKYQRRLRGRDNSGSKSWEELSFFKIPDWVHTYIDNKLSNRWDYGKEQIVYLRGRTFDYKLTPDWVTQYGFCQGGPLGMNGWIEELPEKEWGWVVHRRLRR